MAEYNRIVSDSEIMGGEPRVRGTRLTVRQIREMVEIGREDPITLAQSFSLHPSTVYIALAYYHEHEDEIASVKSRKAEAEKRTIKDPDTLLPPERPGRETTLSR